MNVASFIGPRLRMLALALGGALLGAGVFLPAVAAYATPAGVAALFVGGLGLQVPQWATVRPLLPATLVPTAVALAQALQHPEGLPLPENLKPWAPLVAGLLALLAGKVLPVHGTYPSEAERNAQARGEALEAANAKPLQVRGSTIPEALEKASRSGLGALLLLCGLALLQGCATGPQRKTVSEALSEPETTLNAAGEESASPFSAGFSLAVGVPFKGGEVLPAQLVVGSAKVMELKLAGQPHAVNLLAVGGVSGTSISKAEGAWGAGLGLELTPGTLLYEVDASAGVFWSTGHEGPMGFLGFAVCPKM